MKSLKSDHALSSSSVIHREWMNAMAYIIHMTNRNR